jgi:hypothetical protein
LAWPGAIAICTRFVLPDLGTTNQFVVARLMAFTCCQGPVVYWLAKKPFLAIELVDRKQLVGEVLHLDEKESRAILERAGTVKSIVCGVSCLGTSNHK